MSRFERQGAQSYEARIKKLVPGYDLMHQLTAAQLQVRMPDSARILVVGAGAGTEIIRFAALNSEWRFVALDLSKDMLAIAQRRFAEAGCADRVTSFVGPLSHLPNDDDWYDAVVCLLVMHFIPGIDQKSQFMAEVAHRLKPAGVFLLVDLMQPESPEERQVQGQVCAQLGLAVTEVNPMLRRLEQDFHPWTFEELSTAAQARGVGEPNHYFRAVGFHGYWMQKSPVAERKHYGDECV